MIRVHRRRNLMRTFAAFALTATSATGLMAAQHSPATAEPGDPELAPILWHEDFENGLADGQVELLPDYTGADETTYTADDYWVNVGVCNGMVLDGTTTEAAMSDAGCEADNTGDAANWAAAIGSYHGDGAAAPSNHALASWTSPIAPHLVADPGVLVRSSSISVTPGHYLALGFNYFAAACDPATQPHFVLAVGYQGADEEIVEVGACDGGSPGTLGTWWRVPEGVTEIQFVVSNTQRATAGNDFAVDDLTVRDLTPQLDQTFDPAKATTGDPVAMTYTVTNTGDPDAGEPIVAKTDFSFRDLLPTGLRVVELGDTTCGDGKLTEDPKGTVAFEGGDLADGQESCAITLTVTADKAGTYGNGQVPWSTNGVLPFDDVTVTFVDRTDPADDDTGDDTDPDDDPIFVAPDTGSTR